MKPTNSPTQGHPNPRKIRLKAAYLGHFFSTANIFSWVEVDFTHVPRKNRLKAAYLGHFFSTANIFSWVEVDFTHVGNTLQETSRDLILFKHPNDCRLIVLCKIVLLTLVLSPGVTHVLSLTRGHKRLRTKYVRSLSFTRSHARYSPTYVRSMYARPKYH